MVTHEVTGAFSVEAMWATGEGITEEVQPTPSVEASAKPEASSPWYDLQADDLAESLRGGTTSTSLSKNLGGYLLEVQRTALGYEPHQGTATILFEKLFNFKRDTFAEDADAGLVARVDQALAHAADAMVHRAERDWTNGKFERILYTSEDVDGRPGPFWIYNSAVDIELKGKPAEWALKRDRREDNDDLYRMPDFRVRPAQNAEGEILPYRDGATVIVVPDPYASIQRYEVGEINETELKEILTQHWEARHIAASHNYKQFLRSRFEIN